MVGRVKSMTLRFDLLAVIAGVALCSACESERECVGCVPPVQCVEPFVELDALPDEARAVYGYDEAELSAWLVGSWSGVIPAGHVDDAAHEVGVTIALGDLSLARAGYAETRDPAVQPTIENHRACAARLLAFDAIVSGAHPGSADPLLLSVYGDELASSFPSATSTIPRGVVWGVLDSEFSTGAAGLTTFAYVLAFMPEGELWMSANAVDAPYVFTTIGARQ